MDYFLRLIRPLVWFLIGFFLVVVAAFRAEVAYAAQCGIMIAERQSFSDACAANQYYCDGIYSWRWACSNTPCENGGVTVPGCRREENTGENVYHYGFGGTCPTAGSEGPGIEYSLSAGEQAPDEHCNGPCKIDSDWCTESGLPDGTTDHFCGTSYTGETCVPGGGAPETPEPEEPHTCDPGNEVEGECVTIEDSDGDTTNENTEPAVCYGTLCNEIPPNENHAADCATTPGAAVCVGNPGDPGSAPAPPSPPWPNSQEPAFSTSSTSPAGSTPIEIYGAPQDDIAGPPDENGLCPNGTTLSGGVCRCPVGDVWNGTGCVDANGSGEESDGVCDETNPNDPDCGEERTAEYGSCGETPPACSGDAIDCSILRQTWATRCALTGSEPPPDVDIESDPLAPYGGEESFFETIGEDDGVGPNGLDYSGFLGGTSCPAAPILPEFRGAALVIPPVWCDLGFVYYITLAIATFIAFRIVMGEND